MVEGTKYRHFHTRYLHTHMKNHSNEVETLTWSLAIYLFFFSLATLNLFCISCQAYNKKKHPFWMVLSSATIFIYNFKCTKQDYSRKFTLNRVLCFYSPTDFVCLIRCQMLGSQRRFTLVHISSTPPPPNPPMNKLLANASKCTQCLHKIFRFVFLRKIVVQLTHYRHHIRWLFWDANV